MAYLLTYALLVLAGVRLLGVGMVEGFHPVHGRIGWQVWTTERLMGMARIALFPLYASLFTPVWLRLLGAKVGARRRGSTVIALPKMTTVGDGAFLADDTMVGTYELGGGWLHVAPSRIGKQAFLGNSGMTAAGRSVPKRGLVGVLSSTPRKAKKGSSWLGLPPMPLRRTVSDADTSRTYDPPRRLKLARGLVELCRVVPVMCAAALAVLVLGGVLAAWSSARARWSRSCWPARCCWPPGSSPRQSPTAREVAAGRAGSGPSSTRCGAPSCGATSSPTRSSRCWPCRGWRVRQPARRC